VQNFEPNLLIILEIIMKKIAILASAVTVAVASTAASAWGWGDNGYNDGYGNGYGNGYGDGYGSGDFDADASFGFSMGGSASGRGRGYGNGYNGYRGHNGYGYAPYGVAPYGYAPVQPAVQMTDEEKKVIADQQAKYMEDMQKAQQQAQQQAAEFYANQRAPMTGMQNTGRLEERQARIAEMDARMEEFRKASDARRLETGTAQAQGAPMTDTRAKMQAEHDARVAEMDARFEAFKKDSEARRLEAGANRGPMMGMDANRQAERQARIAEMDARMDEFKKASDARRQEMDAAYKTRCVGNHMPLFCVLCVMGRRSGVCESLYCGEFLAGRLITPQGRIHGQVTENHSLAGRATGRYRCDCSHCVANGDRSQ